jgi:hypothetical protein
MRLNRKIHARRNPPGVSFPKDQAAEPRPSRYQQRAARRVGLHARTLDALSGETRELCLQAQRNYGSDHHCQIRSTANFALPAPKVTPDPP